MLDRGEVSTIPKKDHKALKSLTKMFGDIIHYNICLGADTTICDVKCVLILIDKSFNNLFEYLLKLLKRIPSFK